MIRVNQAEQIHHLLIEKFGGTKGIRDKGLLDAALMRPYASFDNQELYPTPTEKAAALVESVVKNHPFLDGNKRIGYVLMRLTLLQNGFDIKASQEDKYTFIIQISQSKVNIEEIKSWIKNRLVKI